LSSSLFQNSSSAFGCSQLAHLQTLQTPLSPQ
jgi:hypothetical protein